MRHHIARVDIARLVSVFEYRCSLQDFILIQGVLYELLIGFMFVVLFFLFYLLLRAAD